MESVNFDRCHVNWIEVPFSFQVLGETTTKIHYGLNITDFIQKDVEWMNWIALLHKKCKAWTPIDVTWIGSRCPFRWMKELKALFYYYRKCKAWSLWSRTNRLRVRSTSRVTWQYERQARVTGTTYCLFTAAEMSSCHPGRCDAVNLFLHVMKMKTHGPRTRREALPVPDVASKTNSTTMLFFPHRRRRRLWNIANN